MDASNADRLAAWVTWVCAGFAASSFVFTLATISGLTRRLGERRYYRTMALLTALLGAQRARDRAVDEAVNRLRNHVAEWGAGDVSFVLILQWDGSAELRVLAPVHEPFLPDTGARLRDVVHNETLNRLYLNEKKLIARIGRLLEEYA